MRKRPKTDRVTRTTTSSMDDIPARVSLSCRGGQSQRCAGLCACAGAGRAWRAKLRRMQSAASQMIGCATSLIITLL
jgi:hypothetical protein